MPTMRKRILVALMVGVVVVLVVVLCFGKEKGCVWTAEDFMGLDHTLTEQDIHEKFGMPSKMLNGFWGDVYELKDGSEIIIYYDAMGFVSDVKIGRE